MPDKETGQRIARARRRRGLSQAVLAQLVGRSESWLSQVERGKRNIDSHAVLTRLADVLRVDIGKITAPARNEEDGRAYEPSAAIERAMMSYGETAAAIGGRSGAERDTAHLRAMARAAYRDYQATRYENTGRMLPALIRDVEALSHAAGGDRPDACGVRALVYDTTAALLHRVGQPALAWAAADRAISAAEQSGKPVLTAAAAWRLAHVINGGKHPQQALELAMATAAALERVMRAPGPDVLSIYGALHLAAASAAAAVYDRALTGSLLTKAREIADQAGDGNHMGTAFGHANVAMHAISAALQLGEAKMAVETGESLDPGTLPASCTGRRTQLHLDLACAYAMRKQDAAAVNLLIVAERLSTQLIHYDARTHEVLTALLRREHQPSTPQLRPLARRVGVI